jgi:hypothetical protein
LGCESAFKLFLKTVWPSAGVGCKNVLVLRPKKQIMSPVNQTTHFEESSALNSRSLGTISHGMEWASTNRYFIQGSENWSHIRFQTHIRGIACIKSGEHFSAQTEYVIREFDHPKYEYISKRIYGFHKKLTEHFTVQTENVIRESDHPTHEYISNRIYGLHEKLTAFYCPNRKYNSRIQNENSNQNAYLSNISNLMNKLHVSLSQDTNCTFLSLRTQIARFSLRT